jgi:Photoprotection regulator fluorescence recovery protein
MQLTMTPPTEIKTETMWSAAEHAIAQNAFQTAYTREIDSLMQAVRKQCTSIDGLDTVWKLNDFLNSKRHEIEGKYDYREPALVFVFATLLHDGWLSMDDLCGLDQLKLDKISAISNM